MGGSQRVDTPGMIERKDRRILIGVHAIPGQGGATTAAYELLKHLQRDGVDAWFLALVSEELVDYYHYIHGEDYANPARLPNVLSCVLREEHILSRGAQEPLSELIRSISPDVILGTDFVPTLLLGNSAPERTLVFLTAGSEQAAKYIRDGRARDLISLLRHLGKLDRPPQILHPDEQAAVRISDLVMTHGDVVGELYRRFYPFDAGRIYSRSVWFAEWALSRAKEHAHLARPWSEREIDVLFVANRWARPEKNYRMVRKIISRCHDLNIAVVGEVPDRQEHTAYYPFISAEERLFGLFGRARSVVVPSVLDAAPGVLFEASALQCNVVASKNCGNWRLCNEALLVDPPDLGVYVDRIRRAVERKLPDNMAYFLLPSSYRDLVDTLAVV